MRVGIVSHWFNRGQATIARYLRSALHDLGHETHLLARPTKPHFYRPSYIATADVWAQPHVTHGSSFDMPMDEYERWARGCGLDAVVFLQNYQFDAIAALRERGMRTLGWFAWEAFRPDHVTAALHAYDAIFSLTRCQQVRYADMGIDSPLVRWGCHPELLGDATPPPGRVTFLFPGGYLSRRKPLAETVEAFRRVPGDDLRLVVKTQGVHPHQPTATEIVGDDPRIEVVDADLSTAEHRALCARADVMLAPSRWEGLGLHLYEATAIGVPIVTTDRPPMSEVVVDGYNGLLVRSDEVAPPTPSGVPAYEPRADALAAAIEACRASAARVRLADGTRERAAALDWRLTVSDLAALLDGRLA